jgi:hypothetical protein
MGKTIGKSRVFAKHTTGTSGGGGGGATAQEIAYTDVTLAVAQAKQAGTAGAFWTEGFYRVTGVDVNNGNFYSKTIKKGATVQLELDGIFETTCNNIVAGSSTIIGKANLNLVLGIIDDFEYTGPNQAKSAYIYQRIRTTNGLSAFDIGNDAYVWGSSQFNNFEAIDPTITFTGVLPDSQSVAIQNTINSNGDTFAFTNDGQAIYSLNEGYGRTISFANVNGLTYSNCIIQSGKTITINSSQSGKYWVDTRSTFVETIDVDVAVTGSILDLTGYEHAGIIMLTSPLTASPTIDEFANWTYVGMTRTFTIADPVTTNPNFSSGLIQFPVLSSLTSPFTLVTTKDLVVINYVDNKFLITADSNTY